MALLEQLFGGAALAPEATQGEMESLFVQNALRRMLQAGVGGNDILSTPPPAPAQSPGIPSAAELNRGFTPRGAPTPTIGGRHPNMTPAGTVIKQPSTQEVVSSVAPPQQDATTVPDMIETGSIPERPLPGSAYSAPPLQDSPKVQPSTPAVPTSVSQPSDMERFGAILKGFGDSNQGLIARIGGAISGGTGYDKAIQTENQTARALMKRGNFSEDEALMIARNPALLSSVAPVLFGGGTLTDDMREYRQDMEQRIARGEDPNKLPTLGKWIKETRRTNMPVKLDGGDHWQLIDPQSQEVLGTYPKNIEEAAAAKARGKELGEGQGKATVNLPMAEFNAQKMVELIDGVLNNPKLDDMVGPVSGMLPNVTGAAHTLQAQIDQIQGRTFLTAFDALRGGGAITEMEGKKATEAYNRLANMKVTDEGYMQALKEFRQDVVDLLEVARKKAAGGGSSPSQTGALPPATNGVRTYNPANGRLE